MPVQALSGVIAAIATPIDAAREPDLARAMKLARYLLDNGCDGLNVLGTTGEATSFSLAQRQRVMRAYRENGLDTGRLMVGTGAAALADAVALTRSAAEFGFAGALVLPPFYYKGALEDGIVAYIDALVDATREQPIPLYLYHYPALSGHAWTLPLIKRLLAKHGERIGGLKDSSGDMPFAHEAAKLAPHFKVFPSNEATLIEGRGTFGGCISATANLNADLCQRAWREGDTAALAAAVTIRKLFEGKALVPGVKALLAHIHQDQGFALPLPPLSPFSEVDRASVIAGYDTVRRHHPARHPAPVAATALHASH